MFDAEERLVRITDMIERHRYNMGVTSCEIAEQVVEVDEEYMAAERAAQETRTDGFHSDI